ncbi:MAG: LysM peptidoglycan-binding domain-containing protein [Vicinamibacterales bacterium]|jgi:penicillin-insensitive murein endopeptidase|nr:LysM peptidoglycan-binding domain-containing protein [Vicinamibacterales bacterium]
MKAPFGLLVVVWLVALPPGAGAPLSASAASSERSSRDTPAALLSLSDEELARRVELDVTSLGSLSIGAPGSAMLINPVTLAAGPYWEIAEGAEVFGTSETIAAIDAALAQVHEIFPDAHPIVVGDISDEDGGRLKRHKSHQGGRDVDLGFFVKAGTPPHFVAGTAANLDLPKNWALVRSLVTCTDVETVLLDTRIQRLLYKYALGIGEDKAWLDRVFYFARGSKSAIVKHVSGHRNHYHVRFYNPVAQELGRRVHPMLVELKLVDPPVYTVRHVVRSGQTLGQLAARYGTSVRAIRAANGMSSNVLRAGRSYRIPVKAAAPPSVPVVVPCRLLPPATPAVLASAVWPTAASLYGDSVSLRLESAALLARAVYIF